MKHKKLTKPEVIDVLNKFYSFSNKEQLLFLQNLSEQLRQDGINDENGGRKKLGYLLKNLADVMLKVRKIWGKSVVLNQENNLEIFKKARKISNSNYDSMLLFYTEWTIKLLNDPSQIEIKSLIKEAKEISQNIADLCSSYN